MTHTFSPRSRSLYRHQSLPDLVMPTDPYALMIELEIAHEEIEDQSFIIADLRKELCLLKRKYTALLASTAAPQSPPATPQRGRKRRLFE